MGNNKGITLIMAVMTVLIIAIIAGVSITVGVNTYRNAQIVEFETTMSIIQKKVDIIVETGDDILKFGSTPSAADYNKFRGIISEKNGIYIKTDLDELSDNTLGEKNTIRKFRAINMNKDFGVDTDSTFLINFETREVINLDGVEIGGETFFVLDGLHEVLEGND